jgi:hypothetical protein
VPGVQVLERRQRGRKEIPQLVPQPLGVTGPFPDQRLVRAGYHLDCLRGRGIGGDLAQLMEVGADHVGQHVRVRGVALGLRHPVPFPVPRRLQRVDPEHLITRGGQRHHPQAPAGLDPDPHHQAVLVVAGVLADHRVQPGHPGRALFQPRPGQYPAAGVHYLDVVILLRPVISHEQLHSFSVLDASTGQPAGEPSAT